jgi:hypothetical protein
MIVEMYLRNGLFGGIVSALRASPLRGRPAGVIPASWQPHLTDPDP